MTPSALLAAALDVLQLMETDRRPVSEILTDWGRTHRFAGAKDRSALASLVFDVLRVKASSAFLMEESTARALLLGTLRQKRGLEVQAIASLFSGEKYACAPLTSQEESCLAQPLEARLAAAPLFIRANLPEWLLPSFIAAFGEEGTEEEGKALAERAPLDLRVNLLKSDRAAVLRSLESYHPQVTPFSPWGIRCVIGPSERGPRLHGEPSYIKGHVEIQDEGSQLAAKLTLAEPGWTVLDFCAGAGGKTLALSALMKNRGQIYASDSEGARLKPLYERMKRAGTRNIQIRFPQGDQRKSLSDLQDRCDLVVVDAPCSGTGTWRRAPDAKWRIRPGSLEIHKKRQAQILEAAALYVKPTGLLVYITCSLLREENEEIITQFLTQAPSFLPLNIEHMGRRSSFPWLARFASPHGIGVRFSPFQTQTDGFYVAVLSQMSF